MNALVGDQWIGSRPLRRPEPTDLVKMAVLTAKPHIERMGSGYAGQVVEVCTSILQTMLGDDDDSCNQIVNYRYDHARGNSLIQHGNLQYLAFGQQVALRNLAEFARCHRMSRAIGRFKLATIKHQKANGGYIGSSSPGDLVFPAELLKNAIDRSENPAASSNFRVKRGTATTDFVRGMPTSILVGGPAPALTMLESLAGKPLHQVIEIPDTLTDRERAAWEQLTITKAGIKADNSYTIELEPAYHLPIEEEPDGSDKEYQAAWRDLVSVLTPI